MLAFFAGDGDSGGANTAASAFLLDVDRCDGGRDCGGARVTADGSVAVVGGCTGVAVVFAVFLVVVVVVVIGGGGLGGGADVSIARTLAAILAPSLLLPPLC